MKILLAILLLLGTSLANAEGDDLQLVGEARLKVLFWPVYDSRLYTADGDYDPGQRPVKLEIQYLRDIKSDDLVSRTGQEWQDQGIQHPRIAEWLVTLSALWPDVSNKDTLALVVDEGEQSRFYRNGALLGAVEDPDFGRHFLGIWLSPETTRPELRLALIGADTAPDQASASSATK